MIRVICYTHIVDYQEETWPDFLCCRPQLGDYVKSNSGKELKIVRIAHGFNKSTKQAYLSIELWK